MPFDSLGRGVLQYQEQTSKGTQESISYSIGPSVHVAQYCLCFLAVAVLTELLPRPTWRCWALNLGSFCMQSRCCIAESLFPRKSGRKWYLWKMLKIFHPRILGSCLRQNRIIDPSWSISPTQIDSGVPWFQTGLFPLSYPGILGIKPRNFHMQNKDIALSHRLKGGLFFYSKVTDFC